MHARLANGLTEDGAAQALGWPKARVTARIRLLELPEAPQQMVGAGAIALSCVEQLRAIGRVSPALLNATTVSCAARRPSRGHTSTTNPRTPATSTRHSSRPSGPSKRATNGRTLST